MFQKTLRILTALAVVLGGAQLVTAAEMTQADQIAKLKKQVKSLERRVMKNERKTALDRLNITGDFRFEAHSIDGDIPSHFDGMYLQKLMVDTMFYSGATGQMPSSLGDVSSFIAQNYAQYLYFSNNLTFDQLKGAVGQMPPEQVQGLMQFLMPNTYVQGYDYSNDILYTNRLRLNLDAKVADNVSFQGRLSMYKVWGDSTGIQVFNGQSNSINIDGNTVGTPNSDILRVERAFFTWKDIAGLPIYLSIGRRPSTEGPPMNYRAGEPRGGTPMGTLIDFQFDGATFGWHISDHTTARLCYGVGYESGFGSGDQLQLPADRLKDASFLGLNLDAWHSDDMLLQFTAARAFDVTDGFNGLVVLPNNPVTGAAVGAPIPMRFTPSTNLGDIDLAGVVLTRRDGPFDWFVSYNYMSSDPNDATTPFGGLFSDPFETPKSQSGDMIYLGAIYNFANDKTQLGVEYNHGSKYWFNFSPAQDDIIAPKTATRGDVWELYLLHKINKHFLFKLDYIDYSYDYSGSGWHLGAPKPLDSTPVLGFPTYSSAKKFMLGMTARF